MAAVVVDHGFAYLVDATPLDDDEVAAGEEDPTYTKSLSPGITLAYIVSVPCFVTLSFEIHVTFKSGLPALKVLDHLCDSLWRGYIWKENSGQYSLATKIKRFESVSLNLGAREHERPLVTAYLNYMNREHEMPPTRPWYFIVPVLSKWENTITFTSRNFHAALYLLTRLSSLNAKPFKQLDIGLINVVWAPPPYVVDKPIPWLAKPSAFYFQRNLPTTMRKDTRPVTWQVQDAPDLVGSVVWGAQHTIITPTLPGYVTDNVIHNYDIMRLKELFKLVPQKSFDAIKEWQRMTMFARPDFLALSWPPTGKLMAYQGHCLSGSAKAVPILKRPRIEFEGGGQPEEEKEEAPKPKREKVAATKILPPQKRAANQNSLDSFFLPKK